MTYTTKIATLNLCLGLRNKKEAVKRLINENKIDILCIQETEIPSDFPVDLLSFKGFNYESENNNVKSRCGIYISNAIPYVRRIDLESIDAHVVIIELNNSDQTRIINVYRPFNPQTNESQLSFFSKQLDIIKNATNNKSIILGDFNLNHHKRYDINYSHKNYFIKLNEAFENLNLIQIVTFDTWSRFINNVHHSSTLDHIYVKNPVEINNLSHIIPPFGDHCLILFNIKSKSKSVNSTLKRNWKSYSKDKLISQLNAKNWSIENDDVQSYWNSFESNLIEVVDNICPLETIDNLIANRDKPPIFIKRKINKRNNLLRKIKSNPTNSHSARIMIKQLNKEIKSYFFIQKTKSVRRNIIPSNSKSLWDAVRIAKDKNPENLPDTMFMNNIEIPKTEIPQAFADYFSNKVNIIVNEVTIDNEIYNGYKKVNSENKFFMSSTEIKECIKNIKIKNCEGYDRIPQRILSDGFTILSNPLRVLFSKIYHQKSIPEQWLISKIIPIRKKGPKNNVENYRPIANLCSTSKIFERLILKRIQSIELFNNVDITGKQQHGFKKCKSTTTLALQIQSLIARALDDDNYVLMASIDLSAAFDVINVDLLLKRLKIVGLPDDVVSLIEIWLRNRMFYVEIDDLVSKIQYIDHGTIQGSILGPILYAIFVAPLFDLTNISNFADDNFALTWSTNKRTAISQMENKLSIITKWLAGSGLKINEQKTELCHFYRKDTPQVEITVNNTVVKSTTEMNVLGVLFDSKLTWSNHVSKQINKANKALHAIKMIRKYFSDTEMLTLLTSNYYSVLYYNSEVWHLPNLKPQIKQLIFSASAKALKLTQRRPDQMESFLNIHHTAKRATPEKLLLYKHAILLYKLYNNQTPNLEWVDLHFKQTFNPRHTHFNVVKDINYKIGNNILTSRLTILNRKIILSDLNLSLQSFKVKYKEILLKP